MNILSLIPSYRAAIIEREQYKNQLIEVSRKLKFYGIRLDIAAMDTVTHNKDFVQQAILNSGITVNTMLLDNVYNLPRNRTTVEKFLSESWLVRKPWLEDEFDCENFSFQFKVMASWHNTNGVGVMLDWLSAHSYNIIITSEGEVILVEPQSSRIIQPGDSALYGVTASHAII
jgi:hypothetical protein